MSVVAELRRLAGSAPDRTAVTLAEDGSRWSYGRLDDQARRIAAWLQGRLAVGDRVVVRLPTGFEFVAALAGCLYAGMVAVPTAPGDRRTPGSAVLTDTAHAGRADDLPTLAVDGGDLPGADAWIPVEVGPDHPAVLSFTSGATGEPKGVLLSHRNLLHNVDSQRRAFALTADTRAGGWLPLHHSLGLFGLVLPALLLGGGCVLMRPSTFLRRPHDWLRMIDEYAVEVSAAPNFAYEMVRARVTDEQLEKLDLSRWRVAVAGAEKVDAATLDAFAKRFAPAGLRSDALCAGYGLAEATVFVSTGALRPAVVTRVDPAELERRRFVPATNGTPLVSYGVPADCKVLIVDPRTGQVLPPGEIGEIRLRGASIGDGRGFWRTGDLGTRHDGELYVIGRLAEAITVDGRELFPQDIERALRERHRDRLGLIGAVFTVPRAGAERLVITHEVKGRPAADRLRELAGDLRRTVEREFGVAVAGVALLRSGAVLRTPSGKIRRVAMRRRVLNGGLGALHSDF